MMNAQLGNPSSYYGNINLGNAQVPLFTWGAWEIIGHYQSPLTVQEEAVIAEHQGTIPEPPVDHAETIQRLQQEARATEIRHAPTAKKIKAMKPKNYNDDEEAFFILLN